MQDDDFNLRLCQYALEFLADSINTTQKQIVDSRIRLEQFPDTAFSDYAVKWGNKEPLAEVFSQTKQGYEYYNERLEVLQGDYDILANKMSEYSKRRLSEMVASVFGKNQGPR